MQMPAAYRPRTTPSSKDIAQQIRERIASGDWPINQRIPTKMELCQLFGTSNMTMQKALSVLASEGFIRSRGRAGTFVNNRPPSNHRIAFVVPVGLTRSLWYGSLIRGLALQDQELAALVDVYQASPDGTTPDDAALLDDCLAHRLAGALFAAPFPELTRLLGEKAPKFPAMYLFSPAGPLDGHGLATASPADLVVGAFSSRGRRRFAMLSTFMQRGTLTPDVVAKAQASGLRCEPEWVHALDPRNPDIARAIARLLATLPAERRPDALYISDDHLATETTAGLLDAGLRAPEDIDIICHANIPFPPPTCMPVTYAGYDVIELMRIGLGSISRMIAGQSLSPRQLFQPILCNATDMAHRQEAVRRAEMRAVGEVQ
jgi:DNA-binding LacI/PurR family transcriptional regulator